MQNFVKSWVLNGFLNFGAINMHCPRCGQQQVSEDIKFCSRCGLPLGVVSEVLAQGGYLPQLDELLDQKKTSFNKKNGVVFSVIWAIFCFFLAIVFDGILNINRVGEFFVASGIFGGILIFLISLVYLPEQQSAARFGRKTFCTGSSKPARKRTKYSAASPANLSGDRLHSSGR